MILRSLTRDWLRKNLGPSSNLVPWVTSHNFNLPKNETHWSLVLAFCQHKTQKNKPTYKVGPGSSCKWSYNPNDRNKWGFPRLISPFWRPHFIPFLTGFWSPPRSTDFNARGTVIFKSCKARWFRGATEMAFRKATWFGLLKLGIW